MPTIVPKDSADSQRLARELLAAAGDRPERVRTVTAGGVLAFEVDDDLAAKVGTGDYTPEPEQAPAEADQAATKPVKAPAKKAAPRKTAAKSTQ